MIHTTTWRPDTCGCVLEYKWDDALNEDQRVHTPTENTVYCAAHSPEKIQTRLQAKGEVLDQKKQAHEHIYEAVLKENQTKNLVLASLTESDDLAETVTENGQEVRKFKIGQEPVWQFDKDRNLKITLPVTLPKTQKEALKSAVLSRHTDVALE